MIKVKITSKVGATFEKELPSNIHELHHALVEMGIRKTPREKWRICGKKSLDNVRTTLGKALSSGPLIRTRATCTFPIGTVVTIIFSAPIKGWALGLPLSEDSFRKLTEEELAEEQGLDMDEDEDFGMKM